MRFRSIGKLRYSPQINGSLLRRDGGTTKWWLVIDCDPAIGKYYRELFHLTSHRTQSLQRPAWESHISVIRNEPPPNKSLWKAREGQKIEYEYIPEPVFNGIYVWLPVVCEPALDIREALGLARQPEYPLHLTIGNRKFEGEEMA